MHAMDPQQRPSEREREMRAGISTFFVTALCGGLAIGSTASAAAPDQTGREILPVPPQPFTGVMKPALDQSTPVWSQLVKAPQDAPNILLVMTADVGFGASRPFGGRSEERRVGKEGVSTLK